MDVLSEIKTRLNISDVVRDYAVLHPQNNGTFTCLCPFHDDHNPSMIVNDRKGLAWCFSCSSGGDLFSFVTKVENCDFFEALKLLAEKADVPLQKNMGGKKERKDEKERLFEVLEETTHYFEKQFLESSRAQKVFANRHFSPEIRQKWRLGFAPKSEHGLEKYLLEKKFSRQEMINAGVVTAQDAHLVRDKFRDRIMFPIWNSRGRICGFGGRYIGNFSDAPKYLNSPETAVFKKSEILYGLHAAQKSIQKEKTALLVEGYFDAIACHFAGITNAVAINGVAFTPQHARLISRFGDEVALALDRDPAGQSAARRSAETALKKRLRVSVVTIPEGKDPDEAVRENKVAFLNAIRERRPGMDAFFERSFLYRDVHNIADRKAIADELLPLISAFENAIERDFFLQKLAKKMGTSVEALEDEEQKKNVRPLKKNPEQNNRAKMSPVKYILATALAFPEDFSFFSKHLFGDLFPAGKEKTFYKKLIDFYTESGSLDLPVFWTEINDERVEKEWQIAALFAEEEWKNFSPLQRHKELKTMFHRLHARALANQQKVFAQQLKTNPENAPQILKKMNELQKLFHPFHS